MRFADQHSLPAAQAVHQRPVEDVVTNEAKVGMVKQVVDVGDPPSAQIVQNGDMVVSRDKRIGQMGADVTSATGDQGPHNTTSALSRNTSYPKPLKNQVNRPTIHSKTLNWSIGVSIPLNGFLQPRAKVHLYLIPTCLD